MFIEQHGHKHGKKLVFIEQHGHKHGTSLRACLSCTATVYIGCTAHTHVADCTHARTMEEGSLSKLHDEGNAKIMQHDIQPNCTIFLRWIGASANR